MNELKSISLESISPADYNPRFLSDDARCQLKASLQELGVIKPIIVNGDNNIIVAGHQRTSVMKELGITEVPAFVIHNVNKQDEVRFNQFHNRCEYEFDDSCPRIIVNQKLNEGWNIVSHKNLIVNSKGKKSQENRFLCKLLLKYGTFGSSIATTDGTIFISAGYAFACKLCGIDLYVYCVDSKKAERCKYYFSKSYGVFNYDCIKRNTYAQGLAQMSRLPKEGKAKHSSLYETLVFTKKNQLKGKRIIDFGAGKYEYAERLKQQGYDIDYVDPYHMKSVGIISVNDNKKRFLEICEHIKKFGLYDVVICDSVLNSVDSEEARKSVILTCYGLCKDGGNIIISGRMFQKSSMGKSTINKATDYFLDDNGYSAIMRNNKWFFQKFDNKEQIQQIGILFGESKVLLASNTWKIDAIKKHDKKHEEEIIKALRFEWDLPLPKGSYGLSNEIENSYRYAISNNH